MKTSVWPVFLLSISAAYGRPRGRILGGQETPPHQMPFMASLQENGEHVCGGFLIASQWVLSAAHCLEDTVNRTFQVLLGAHSLSSPEPHKRLYNVRRLVPHPGSSRDTDADDLLLVQLEDPAVLSRHVQPLGLQREDREVPAGTLCQVAGWGITSNTRRRPDKLQSVELPVMSRERCNRRDVYDGEITEKLMCTESNKKDSCKGDSGGPLVCHGVAAGVVATGSPVCGNRKKPGIYTRIPPYLAWIDGVMSLAN